MDLSIYGKAADVIRERGHTKHVLEDRPGGSVCLAGALNMVCHQSPNYNHNPWECNARSALHWLGIEEATDFNNAAETTSEDVLLLLKYAEADELETWRKLYSPDEETSL